MNRIILILFCITILFSLTSCKSNPPDSMEKWEGDDFILYSLDNSNGFLVYKEDGIVYDFFFEFGCAMYVYEHKESNDQPSVLVAEYGFLTNLSDDRWSCSLQKVHDESLNDIFPTRLSFVKKTEDLTFDDIPYKFVYGNPIKQGITHLQRYELDLYIDESGKTGYIEFVSDEEPEKVLDAVFDDDGNMTIISRADNTKQATYSLREEGVFICARLKEGQEDAFDLGSSIYFEDKTLD